MTTDREHAAMEAAGMTDEEISMFLTACYYMIPNLTEDQYRLKKACEDEAENRAAARFSNEIRHL